MQVAEEIGIEYADSYGCIAVNNTSGYTYLLCEDYSFTLYMPINCGLTLDHVFVSYTNMENGQEYEERLSVFIEMASDPERRHIFNALDAIQQWTEEVESGNGENWII